MVGTFGWTFGSKTALLPIFGLIMTLTLLLGLKFSEILNSNHYSRKYFGLQKIYAISFMHCGIIIRERNWTFGRKNKQMYGWREVQIYGCTDTRTDTSTCTCIFIRCVATQPKSTMPLVHKAWKAYIHHLIKILRPK